MDTDKPQPPHCSTCSCGRRAPVQRGERSKRPSGTVSWEEYLQAYTAYARRYGTDQSAEHLAARWGFGYDELLMFLGHEPKTWLPGGERAAQRDAANRDREP